MRWRPGIGLQLTFTFVAIAVLVLTANFAAQRTVSVTTTRVLSIPPPAVVVQSVPVSLPPRPEIPTTAADPAAERKIQQYQHAADKFDVAHRMRLDNNDEKTAQEYEVASTDLRRYGSLVARQANDRRAMEQELKKWLIDAESLVALADRRRETYQSYIELVEDVNARMQRSVDGAWKIMGRVVARQSVISATQRLGDLRRQSTAFAKAGDYDAGLQQQMQDNEVAFIDLLRHEQDSLARSQGRQWVQQMQADTGQLVTMRATLVEIDAKLREDLVVLVRSGSMLRAQLSKIDVRKPVRSVAEKSRNSPIIAQFPAELPSVSEPAESVSTVVDQGDTAAARRFLWLSISALLLILLISIATAVSIVAPVRRLIRASQRVAKGEVATRVQRGGNRELDGLAVAFNEMAERLAAAQEVAHGYQHRLESDVLDRTRQLSHLAQHDALTGLPNRRQLFTHLETVIANAASRQEHVGVFFLDLDNFKNINDGMGHALGDRLLSAIADRLRSNLGEHGFAARLGGDEFTVVQSGGDSLEELAHDGWELVRAFQKPLQIDGRDLLVSVSVGAGFYPDHAHDAESLLRTADAALFRAKALGRSQLTVFTPDLLEAAASKFSTEQGLRHAVERGELELYYQPEVSLDSLQTTVVEALLRWRTSDGEYLSPGEFLAVAEESGLIIEINDWVLRSGISAAAKWYQGGWQDVRVAINVSARQLFDVRFADRVQELLLEHALPAECLEVELTETVLQTGATTVSGLKRLHEMGVAIALDDFGTGYSSLASLEQLPLTRVKLDRSLIASIDVSARSAAIATAIIGLCKDLGMQITAEGVERPEQLAALRDSGVNIQGYLISRPVSERALLSTVARLPAKLEQLLLEAPTTSPSLASRTVVPTPTGITDTQRRRRLVLATPF
ncbi:MAG: EAL domain-containing protein [Steroidobacteraceae bacterium]